MERGHAGSRQKRRYRGRCVAPEVAPGAAACLAASLMLLMLAFHCVLSPPLGDGPPRRPDPKILQSNNLGGSRRNVLGADADSSGVVLVGGSKLGGDLWGSEVGTEFYGCSNASSEYAGAGAITELNRYLMIETSGGLNQQRTGIIDAVVAARILKASLVIPKLDQESFWNDSSGFADIFNIDSFIASLSNDIKITQQLPDIVSKRSLPYRIRVPRKCTPKCYEQRVLPALLKKHLETDLQKLRCRVNYHALQFTDPIRQIGEMLVQRMREKSGGQFIALHLRFEPDMLAFSGCYFGGGEIERRELGTIRKRWKNLHEANPDRERRHGKCPLTPEEVGLMLRALGFGNSVHIYIASGDVYGGEETLAPLKALFPNFHSKETLASKEELGPFLPFSSRMAALDFIVCDQSKVFVTNNNGNMARMLAGRSTFQQGFMGEPNDIESGRRGFYEYPLDCICKKTKEREGHTKSHFSKNAQGVIESNLIGREGGNLDCREQATLPMSSYNETELDYSHDNGLDIPDLEDMISD
ncbi:hypothetical protein ACP4OV_000616 [Aristida adscensionis]